MPTNSTPGLPAKLAPSRGRQLTPPFSSADREHASLLEQLGHRSKLLSLVREAVMVVDSSDKIVFWNRGAEHLYGWTEREVLGKPSLQLLQTELPRPLPQIETILRREPHWDAEVKQTTREGARIMVATRWALWPDDAGRPLGRFQTDNDITRRKLAEHELRVLSGRLLTMRDEERRRWARELHDSVGQLLVGVTMNLSMLHQDTRDVPAEEKFLNESIRLTNEALREIRTISYLLHPPMLDEVGLISALKWYVSGFSERSRIRVELDVPEILGRYRRELEIALFRIVQEALSNVHRHSKSDSATVTIALTSQQLRLKVEDRGKGMALPIPGLDREAKLPGVGISGIRERVRQLGGQMQIRSGDWGTAMEVYFPLDQIDFSRETSEDD